MFQNCERPPVHQRVSTTNSHTQLKPQTMAISKLHNHDTTNDAIIHFNDMLNPADTFAMPTNVGFCNGYTCTPTPPRTWRLLSALNSRPPHTCECIKLGLDDLPNEICVNPFGARQHTTNCANVPFSPQLNGDAHKPLFDHFDRGPQPSKYDHQGGWQMMMMIY